MEQFDAIVIGLGGMGSACVARLAERGLSVLGIEQFGPVHDRGASSGRTRLIRKAYFEDAAYVPMLLRAYDLWRDLEARTGADILDITGLLMAGSPSSPVLRGAIASAEQHALPLERLDARDVRRRFPAFAVRDDEVAVYENDGGVVFPEAAIEAHLGVAAAAGARLQFHTQVVAWRARAGRVQVERFDGSVVEAGHLVVTAGPWLGELAGDLGVDLRVQRNVQLWFESATTGLGPGQTPPYLIDRPELPAPLYGFPDFGHGIKAAFHAHGEMSDPDQLERGIHATDVDPVRHALDAWLPGAAGALLGGKACMYTLTPDEHFVIAPHPAEHRVIVAGGFSGHGFKFASVVGEIVADLVIDGASRHDIGFLSPARFAHGAAPAG